MIEKILHFSITYPFRILFIILMLAAYGIYSFIQLPIDAVPDITNNQVQINTLSPRIFSRSNGKTSDLCRSKMRWQAFLDLK